MRALVLLLLASATLAPAADLKWVRRATLAASCAASFVDYDLTARGARLGAIEANPLFAGPHGRPRLKLILGVKVASCAVAAVAEERAKTRQSEALAIAVNTATAGVFGFVDVHNLGVIRRLERK